MTQRRSVSSPGADVAASFATATPAVPGSASATTSEGAGGSDTNCLATGSTASDQLDEGNSGGQLLPAVATELQVAVAWMVSFLSKIVRQNVVLL